MFYKKTICNFTISFSANSFITPPPPKKRKQNTKKKENKSQQEELRKKLSVNFIKRMQKNHTKKLKQKRKQKSIGKIAKRIQSVNEPLNLDYKKDI